MSRSLFSVPLGFIISLVSALPLIVNASNVMEGPDDAPEGKIVGQGTGTVGQQNMAGSVPPKRDLRAWTVEKYQSDNANYDSQYGAYNTGYPAAYNSSYYGATGYRTTEYPAAIYNTYGAYGSPATTYNAYGAYGSPNTLYNPSYYGTTGYPATAYNTYGAYGYPNTLNDPYGTYGSPSSLYDPYYGTYNYPSAAPYSPYSPYVNPYRYPGYRPYYPAGNMYNPNTTFVNPPSSLNYPRYPVYSETYLYR